MPNEPTQLMLSTQRGDRRAFDRLVGNLEERAQFMAQNLVGSREEARDMAQEAFLRTYRSRATFREGERFMPWFQRILRNTCYTHLRKRAGTLSIEGPPIRPELGPAVEVADDEIEPPLERLLEQEQLQELERAFAALGPRDREILSLRHHEELPYRDIAARLQVPLGTVMSRLYHARQRLRARLEQDATDPADSPASVPR